MSLRRIIWSEPRRTQAWSLDINDVLLAQVIIISNITGARLFYLVPVVLVEYDNLIFFYWHYLVSLHVDCYR